MAESQEESWTGLQKRMLLDCLRAPMDLEFVADLPHVALFARENEYLLPMKGLHRSGHVALWHRKRTDWTPNHSK